MPSLRHGSVATGIKMKNTIYIYWFLIFHGLISACDHKKMGNQEPKKTSIMQGVDHHELHQKAKKVAVSRLSDYPKFRPGVSVADVAKHILEYGMPDTLDIDSHFEVLFKKDIVTQSEREYLFMKFHKLRLDTSLRSAVLDSQNLPHS